MTPASSMSFAVWFGLLSGGLYLLCLVTVEKSVREKGAGVTTLYQRLGILVPILCSALLGGAVPSAVQLAGLAASVAVMAALWGGGRARGGKGAAGGVPFGGRGGVHRQGVPEMRPGGIPARLSLRAVCRLRGAGPAPPCARTQAAPPAGVALGVAMGACSALSSLLMMNALETVPTGVAYPVLSVGSVAAVTAVDVLVFHRALTRREKLGLALSAVCLVLVNL